jgi:Flp pilus assembly protein TadG
MMQLDAKDQHADGKSGIITALGSKIRSFGQRKDGAAAIEFALVVPLMLSLYFGTLELSQGIEVNKKVGRASSLVADLVTQQAAVTKADIVAISNIAAATLQPYKRSAAIVELVAIQVGNETPPKARVTWSQRVTAGVGSSLLTVGDIINIPSEYLIANSFIMRGTVKVDYYPFTTYQINSVTNGKKGIAMRKEYYLKPRIANTVCPDC